MSDPIGDALRADAEAARAEIRAEGIVCPSCGVNMADLPDGHSLAMYGPAGAVSIGAECAEGMPVDMAAFEALQAATTVAVYDDFRRRLETAWRREVIGEGPGKFTGLLGILEGGEQA